MKFSHFIFRKLQKFHTFTKKIENFVDFGGHVISLLQTKIVKEKKKDKESSILKFNIIMVMKLSFED